MTTRFIGVKELRQNMAAITDKARKKGQRLIVLRKNTPIFELRPLSEKDAAIERLALDIQEGVDDIKAGRVYSHEEVKKIFGLV